MTFEQLQQEPHHLLLKCISGSNAYNLQLPGSDLDIKGIFVLPQKELYGFGHTEQVANGSNDEVYFEIGRFIGLLVKNNPNILELLSSPPGVILFQHPLMKMIDPQAFLSKLCLDTFAGYAKTQIKKAKGLNKKINRPLEMTKKQVSDFCHVIVGNGSVPLNAWLELNAYSSTDCGLVNLAHFRDTYLLYHSSQFDPVPRFSGIVSGEEANDVSLSTVPKGAEPRAVMHFNKDGYSVYCREYREYWEWVEKRNEARYHNTLSHGKNYDSKNMMHTFRLLSMAEEIALHKKVVVYRPDREFLLRIRRGEFEYEALLGMVAEKMNRIDALYKGSDLPDAPDDRAAEALLIKIREQFYAH